MNIRLFLAEDVVNPFTGEIIATRGEELTEKLILDFNGYGIGSYSVCIWKPAEDEDLPFDEDQTSLVINDPSLNLDPPDLSLLDNTDDLIFFDEPPLNDWESL